MNRGKILRKKNMKQTISLLCMIALCLCTSTISNAETDKWVSTNGIITTKASSTNSNLWGVCGYDESQNTVGDITIESSYKVPSGSLLPVIKQIISIMHFKADDGTITGAFEQKILPAVKIASEVGGYAISSRSFYGSVIRGDFLFQDYKNALIGASSFANAQFKSNVTFHLTNGTIYNDSFKDATVEGNFNLLGSIDTIHAYAFSNLTVKGDARMTKTVLHLDSYALANSHFIEFYLSDSLQTIGSHIFDGCEHLNKIKLPGTDCVKEAAPDAFPNEKGLTIVIPEGLTDLSVFHLNNYPNVLFQTETVLPSDSPVIQYLNEHHLMYQQGENGEVIMPGNPEPTTPPSVPVMTPTVSPTAIPSVPTPPAASPSCIPSIPTPPAVSPTAAPVESPEIQPTGPPTTTPTNAPAEQPTIFPSSTNTPTVQPTISPADPPVCSPSASAAPIQSPAVSPTNVPTEPPVGQPTGTPIPSLPHPTTVPPADLPTEQPVIVATNSPSPSPGQNTSHPQTAEPEQKKNKSTAKTVTINKIKYRITSKNSATVLGTTDKKLKKLRIADTIMINGTLYKVTRIEKNAFRKHKKLKSAVIGNYVTKIDSEAFASCKSLTNIQFGTRLKSLGKRVLYQDKKLKKITFKGRQLKKIGSKTFFGVPRKVDIRAVRSKARSYAKLINRSKT